MIYTCTANPSIDYTIFLENELETGTINRANKHRLLAGGKGLNVSMILNQIGIESTAIVFLGGFTGEYIRNDLNKYDLIQCNHVQIKAENRINVKIRSEVETDINMKGPHITPQEKSEFLNYLTGVKSGDWVMICGSLTSGLDFSFLESIAERVHAVNAKLIVDIIGLDLAKLMILKPYLIKPNFEELKAILPKTSISIDNLNKYAIEILNSGVENVVISLGKKGAYYKGEFGEFFVTQPEMEEVNTVGAGDSMLAAIVGVLSKNGTIQEALSLGASSGAATASSIGLSTSDRIHQINKSCTVTKL